MLNIFLRSYRRLIKGLSEAQLDMHHSTSDSNKSSDTDPTPLEDICGKITIYFREDGEFAVASDFTRQDEAAIEMGGILLHRLNSGNLAEYFVQSLKLWAEGDLGKEHFAKEVIKEWKSIFYENNTDKLKSLKGGELAVDPSDVFGLKGMTS